MTEIKLHNTKTRKKEVFTPIDADNVRMYLCGPTVYDRAHLGNARPVVMFDVLNRLLRHVYGPDHVTYVRNFTDVDDKINATALKRREEGAKGTLEKLIKQRTEETIQWYHSDMDALGAARPDHEPRATEYIEEMKDMIAELIEKGFAYPVASRLGHNSQAQYVYLDSTRVPSHVFLKVDKFNEVSDLSYGHLSNRSVEDMIAGARVEVGEGKLNPMDSVLWKPSTIEQPGWESDWGFGRPGWHIECSAMSRKLLGKKFDIHGGGLDLLFPHHENEMAQCEACDGKNSSAQYWLHNEMLQVEGKKMSKSLGNFFTVRDLLDQGVPGEVIRFVFLSTHYRKPMDWTAEKARESEAALRKWRALTAGIEPAGSATPEAIKALADDLNTAGVIAELHRLAREGDAAGLLATARMIGLMLPEMGDWAVDNKAFFEQEIDLIMEMRGKMKVLAKSLMKSGDKVRGGELFKWADEIRDDGLPAFGFVVNDTANGYEWTLKPELRAEGAVTIRAGNSSNMKTQEDRWSDTLKRLTSYREGFIKQLNEISEEPWD